MLKHRLVFGILMTMFFIAIVIFDGWIDGSLTASQADDKPVQATVFCLLIALLAIPAQLELSKLAAAKNLHIFIPITITASILFATKGYLLQFIDIRPDIYLIFLTTFVLFALLLYQYFFYKTSSVLANCGAGYFSILYLGLLSSFCLSIRIDFGLWHLFSHRALSFRFSHPVAHSPCIPFVPLCPPWSHAHFGFLSGSNFLPPCSTNLLKNST